MDIERQANIMALLDKDAAPHCHIVDYLPDGRLAIAADINPTGDPGGWLRHREYLPPDAPQDDDNYMEAWVGVADAVNAWCAETIKATT